MRSFFPLLLAAGLALALGARADEAWAGSQVRRVKPQGSALVKQRKLLAKPRATGAAGRARLQRATKLRAARLATTKRSDLSPRLQREQKLAHSDLPRSMQSKTWKHLTWKQVVRDARKRINDPNLIDQGKQELCGPAATLNAIASTDPRQYIRLVKEVFEQGTFRGKAIPKSLMESKPTSVQPTDWMMLTALRSVNGRPGQRGQHGVSIHSGSLPFELRSWLGKAGFKNVRSKLHLLSARSYKQIPRINETMAKPQENVAILFVRGGFSQHTHTPGKAPTTMDKLKTLVPIHYVRLLTPITRSGDKISFSVFDHGHKRDYLISEKEFGRGVVGAITATH